VRDVRFTIRSASAAAAAALVAAVALAGQTPASAAAASPGKSARPAGGPGHWNQVTALTTNTADIGLVRGADHKLHIIWDTGTTTHRRVMDTPVLSPGAVATAQTIVSGFGSVADPDAVAVPGGLEVFFNAIKNLNTGQPQGTFTATRPASGGNWSLGPVITPAKQAPYLNTDSAGPGGDGKPWVTFAGTGFLGVLHIGHPETRIPPTACCVSEMGVGTDGVSGSTWVAYMSLIQKGQGIWVQRLSGAGAVGNASRLPGSQTGGLVFPINQRVGITGRGHGRSGVYVAYANGYPSPHAIDVLALGQTKPTAVATFGSSGAELEGSTITAGPDGRLWTAWITGHGSAPQLFVRASDVNGRNWGRTVQVPLPSGTSSLWKVYANAQLGRVDLVVLLTRNGNTAYFATQSLLPPPPKKTAPTAPASARATRTTTGSVITARGGAAARPAAPGWHIAKLVPNGARQDAFSAVVATGKTTAMAFQGNAGVLEPTAWVLRNGAWTRVSSFPGRNDEVVMNAAATSPNDVWAFTEGFTSHSASGILSRVLHWNGRAWLVVKTFPDIISEGREAAPNDVWVFGEGGQNAAWFFNGRTWTFEGGNVNGGSVLAANDAWGYTGTFVEHWTGHKWVATNVASLLPPKRASNDPQVTGIIALRPNNVYAIANGFSSSSACGPTIVLHFNGLTWRRVAEGSFGCGPLNQLISPDGLGGLWLPMPDIAALPSYLVHYSGGRLTRAAVPGGFLTNTLNDAANFPGTARALAVGFTHPSNNFTHSLASVILQFS
jgi:hypothetical protein